MYRGEAMWWVSVTTPIQYWLRCCQTPAACSHSRAQIQTGKESSATQVFHVRWATAGELCRNSWVIWGYFVFIWVISEIRSNSWSIWAYLLRMWVITGLASMFRVQPSSTARTAESGQSGDDGEGRCCSTEDVVLSVFIPNLQVMNAWKHMKRRLPSISTLSTVSIQSLQSMLSAHADAACKPYLTSCSYDPDISSPVPSFHLSRPPKIEIVYADYPHSPSAVTDADGWNNQTERLTRHRADSQFSRCNRALETLGSPVDLMFHGTHALRNGVWGQPNVYLLAACSGSRYSSFRKINNIMEDSGESTESEDEIDLEWSQPVDPFNHYYGGGGDEYRRRRLSHKLKHSIIYHITFHTHPIPATWISSCLSL